VRRKFSSGRYRREGRVPAQRRTRPRRQCQGGERGRGHDPRRRALHGELSVRPYDIAVVSDDGKAAAVYVGLTRSDPTISIPQEGPGSAITIHSGLLIGQFVGALEGSIPVGHNAAAFFTGPANAEVQIVSASLSTSGTYTVKLSWRGDPNLTGTLRVLEWSVDAAGFPASFVSTGSIPVTIGSGQRLTGKDVHFTAVGNFRITGTTSLAPGQLLLLRSLSASFPPGSNILDIGSDASASTFDFPAFDLPGTVFNLTALVQDSTGAVVQAWRAGFPPATAVDLSIPAAPVLQPPTVPVAGGLAGTQLSWSPLVPGAVYDLLLRPQSPGGVLLVVTDGTTFQVPDLSAMRFASPGASTYQLDLLAFAPLSPDDVAGGTTQPSQEHDGVAAAPGAIFFGTAP